MSESIHKILTIGAGGAGNYLAQRIGNVLQCHTVAINTDADALQTSKLDETVLIDRRDKRRPVTSLQAIVATRGKKALVQALLEPYDTLVIAVGLGGASGSGISIAVTEMAMDMGLRIIVTATLPFEFETRRHASAIPVMGSLRGMGEFLLVDLERAMRESERHESLNAFFHHQALGLAERVKQQVDKGPAC